MRISPILLLPYLAAMTFVVVSSNYLVQIPFDHFGLKDILTWGAFTYPIAFLINDLTNRRFGVKAARVVIALGFALAVILSIWLATPRIAIASGTAFAVAQLLDASIFDRLRASQWWRAPLISSVLGSVIDTVLFWSLAFAPLFAGIDLAFGMEDGSLGFPVPFFGGETALWISLAVGDFCVKILVGLAMLIPYGLLLPLLNKRQLQAPA
ncbi:MAG: VUT family protein [Pseudomonadota bacterium]